jgi:Na+:H+ antiporter, NhaA family
MSEASTDPIDELPRGAVDRVTEPLARFLHIESASGVSLLACTASALVLANSGLSDAFLGFWEIRAGFTLGSFSLEHSLQHWINDGLMVVFFFVIGLEVKRELVIGELREIRTASLPIAAALGGMTVPALVYLLMIGESEARVGWGIPMATDIAFVVGCIAVLGSRIPHSLRVLLLSIAIADDIGAILVIAIGYTDELNTLALGLGFVGVGFTWLMSRVGIRSFGLYTLVGALIWFAFHESGVHATIAGVILGLMTPAENRVSQNLIARGAQRIAEIMRGDDWASMSHRTEKVRIVKRAARESVSPLEYLENILHPWMGFAIMPIFALANAGVPIQLASLSDPIAIAIGAGLVIGKPLGILLFSWVAVRVGLAVLPQGIGWGAVTGGGFLTRIGFTMALFIAGLALEGDTLDIAKVASWKPPSWPPFSV